MMMVPKNPDGCQTRLLGISANVLGFTFFCFEEGFDVESSRVLVVPVLVGGFQDVGF